MFYKIFLGSVILTTHILAMDSHPDALNAHPRDVLKLIDYNLKNTLVSPELETLSPFWAQEYIGSDLVHPILSRDLKEGKTTKIHVGIIDREIRLNQIKKGLLGQEVFYKNYSSESEFHWKRAWNERRQSNCWVASKLASARLQNYQACPPLLQKLCSKEQQYPVI